jgi:hypothetical protein
MLYLLFWLAAVGVVAWYIDTYIQMTPMIKGLFRLVTILFVLFILFQLVSEFAPPFPRR